MYVQTDMKYQTKFLCQKRYYSELSSGRVYVSSAWDLATPATSSDVAVVLMHCTS